jgi:hypothetical protein
MTANSTEAVTDRAIPLDKLSSRVEGQTGRAGYVVFVLNIGRVINIYNILADPQPKHSQQTDTQPVGAGSYTIFAVDTKPCGSGLARESGLPANINAECETVFVSKPTPTLGRDRQQIL